MRRAAGCVSRPDALVRADGKVDQRHERGCKLTMTTQVLVLKNDLVNGKRLLASSISYATGTSLEEVQRLGCSLLITEGFVFIEISRTSLPSDNRETYVEVDY